MELSELLTNLVRENDPSLNGVAKVSFACTGLNFYLPQTCINFEVVTVGWWLQGFENWVLGPTLKRFAGQSED
jgi:hypothetical protein